MTPEQTNIALRLLECGLPVPNHWIKGTVATIHTTAQLQVDCGHRWRNPYTNEEGGILWTFVTTETGPRLLPDTSDSLLLGWIVAEIERLTGGIIGIDGPVLSGQWIIWSPVGLELGAGMSRLEALTAALEAALAAGKVAQ